MDYIKQSDGKMKVKCKICGLKGHYQRDYTEYSASRFLFASYGSFKDGKYFYICRNCVYSVLDAVKLESYRINKLFEPEVKK